MRNTKLDYPYICHQCGDKGLAYNTRRIFCDHYCKKRYYYTTIKQYREKSNATRKLKRNAKSNL